jgi:hypothetical protein
VRERERDRKKVSSSLYLSTPWFFSSNFFDLVSVEKVKRRRRKNGVLILLWLWESVQEEEEEWNLLCCSSSSCSIVYQLLY